MSANTTTTTSSSSSKHKTPGDTPAAKCEPVKSSSCPSDCDEVERTFPPVPIPDLLVYLFFLKKCFNFGYKALQYTGIFLILSMFIFTSYTLFSSSSSRPMPVYQNVSQDFVIRANMHNHVLQHNWHQTVQDFNTLSVYHPLNLTASDHFVAARAYAATKSMVLAAAHAEHCLMSLKSSSLSSYEQALNQSCFILSRQLSFPTTSSDLFLTWNYDSGVSLRPTYSHKKHEMIQVLFVLLLTVVPLIIMYEQWHTRFPEWTFDRISLICVTAIFSVLHVIACNL